MKFDELGAPNRYFSLNTSSKFNAKDKEVSFKFTGINKEFMISDLRILGCGVKILPKCRRFNIQNIHDKRQRII